MARVLLILPTSTYRVVDFMEAAEALGVEVAVASEEDQVLADQMGDRFLLVDCSRPEAAAAEIVELATTSPIDAIVPVDDQGVLMAALAAAELGLAHNPADAVAATRNKAVLRRVLERSEVPQPAFRVVGRKDDPAAAASELGGPVVVKPLSLSASQGVIRVDHADQVGPTIERVRRILAAAGHNPNEPVLVEQFVPGEEIAVEGLLREGRLEVLAVFDKPDPLEGPYFEETILVTPSRLHPEMLEEAVAVSQRAVTAVGLREGPVHVELRITAGRVRVIELAARSIGGLCGRALRFGLLGTSLEVVLLRHALGLPSAGLQREKAAAGVMMLPIPAAGKLEAIDGLDQARAVPGVTEVDITIPDGRYLLPLPEGDRYLGFIFARGPDPASVEAALRQAHARLTVRIAG